MLDYPPTKISPWANQVEVWNIAKNHRFYYIAHDMGLGKSKSAVDYANGIKARSIIILCPKKVIPHWPRQFEENSSQQYRYLPLTKGTVLQKASQVKQFVKSPGLPYVVIVNYESFWRPPLGPVYDKFKKIKSGELVNHRWDLLIADEAHRVKSPNSEQSWGTMRLGKVAARRLFLSGTPMSHSPADLYAQFRALDSKIFGTSYLRFKNQYCVMSPYNDKQIVAFKNLKELHKKFYSIAHYAKIDEVLDMPKIQDVELSCELEPDTMKLYKDLEEEFVAEHNNKEITVDNVLTKLLRQAQITAGIFVPDNDKQEFIDNNKIDTAIDKIIDLPEKEPVVIFYRFKPEAARIKPELKKIGRKPCEISGDMDEQDKFESGKTDTAVVQIRAGGEGIDILKRAHYGFFLSLTHSLSEYRQAKARLWRPGQNHNCVFYHVIAKNTVDLKILIAIKRKKEIVDYILEELKLKYR